MEQYIARRDFLLSSIAYGISLTLGPRVLAQVLKSSSDNEPFYTGPMPVGYSRGSQQYANHPH